MKLHTPASVNDSNELALTGGGKAGALLEDFLAVIIKVVDAKAGIARVLSPDGLTLRSIGCAGLPPEVCKSESVVDAGCGVCGKAASENAIESSDAAFCKSRFGEEFFGEVCKFVLAVPLGDSKVAGERAGVLTLFFSEQKNMSAEAERSLKTYAELLRIALMNIWRNEDAYQISLLAERQSIANEIHDSLAQNLYYAKTRSSLLADAMKSANELLAYKCAQDIDETLDGSLKTVRELVTHFRCQMDPRGLKFALQKLANDFTSRTNIELEYDDQVEEFNLPLDYELQVFLIVRESLVNVATHSGASTARLIVKCENKLFQFVVEDNGEGVASDAPAEGHYGLAIMRERALRIGGEVEVDNLHGQGTRVQLIFSVPDIPTGA